MDGMDGLVDDNEMVNTDPACYPTTPLAVPEMARGMAGLDRLTRREREQWPTEHFAHSLLQVGGMNNPESVNFLTELYTPVLGRLHGGKLTLTARYLSGLVDHSTDLMLVEHHAARGTIGLFWAAIDGLYSYSYESRCDITRVGSPSTMSSSVQVQCLLEEQGEELGCQALAGELININFCVPHINFCDTHIIFLYTYYFFCSIVIHI
jgi:hypothetical protein